MLFKWLYIVVYSFSNIINRFWKFNEIKKENTTKKDGSQLKMLSTLLSLCIFLSFVNGLGLKILTYGRFKKKKPWSRFSNTSSTTQVKLFSFSDATDSSTTLHWNHLPPFFLIFLSTHGRDLQITRKSRFFIFLLILLLQNKGSWKRSHGQSCHSSRSLSN